MSKQNWIAIALLALWMGACYALRFGVMENQHWVNVCDVDTHLLACDARRLLGLVIHFRVLAFTALAFALIGFIVKSASGKTLSWIALIVGIPSLVLYAATPASFALLTAALRLTRPTPAA